MSDAGAKSLILHIGANKTGSSAIQEFLRLNADALPARGLTVAPADLLPNGNVSGQHVWLIEQFREDIASGEKKIEKRIDRLMAELPDGARLVMSAENLANPDGAERLFGNVAKTYDTRVVLYVRRQDEFLLSSWQQWESKVSDDFWAWVMIGIGLRGNWRRILEAWEKVVPRRNITVRLYDRARMWEGDVIADFAQLLGIGDHLDGLARPERPVNPSYAEAVIDLVKGNPLIFRDKHDNAFFNILEQLTGDKYHRNPRESVITHEQRMAILDRYRDVNAWVRDLYFPDLTGPLFPLPRPEDYDFLSPEKLAEQKWELVASLIFGLSKRVLPL